MAAPAGQCPPLPPSLQEAWSCQILKAVLIWPMDQALSLWPQVRARMWLDDLKLTAYGLTQSLAQSYPGVVASFIEGFEQAVLKVSRGEAGSRGGKTKTVASSKELEAGLREPMRQLGIQVVEATVYLGLGLKRSGK